MRNLNAVFAAIVLALLVAGPVASFMIEQVAAVQAVLVTAGGL